MEIVEIWQYLEENATQIMIFLSHYMWAENTEFSKVKRTNPKWTKLCGRGRDRT